jgi:hypothetical protein
MADFKFFRETGDTLFLDAPFMEVYLPEAYFQNSVAQMMGNSIVTLGIFNFGIYADEKAQTGKIYQMALPVDITISFTGSYKAEKKLKPELDSTVYNVLTLKRGDIFIKDLNIVQDSDSASRFIKLLHGGKLPTDIPYEKVIDIYHKALGVNGVNLGVPSVTLEFIIAELYRNKRDLSQPFRKVAGKGTVNMLEYQTTNLKSLAALNSTFTALSFENMNQSIISSVKKSRDNSKETISPVEKTIKY